MEDWYIGNPTLLVAIPPDPVEKNGKVPAPVIAAVNVLVAVQKTMVV